MGVKFEMNVKYIKLRSKVHKKQRVTIMNTLCILRSTIYQWYIPNFEYGRNALKINVTKIYGNRQNLLFSECNQFYLASRHCLVFWKSRFYGRLQKVFQLCTFYFTPNNVVIYVKLHIWSNVKSITDPTIFVLMELVCCNIGNTWHIHASTHHQQYHGVYRKHLILC